jgi:hypothetical protein
MRITRARRLIEYPNCANPPVLMIVDRNEPEARLFGNLLAIVASAHIDFTCSSHTKVKRIAEMAKAEGILEHGPCEEGWPGGYCAYITDPSGHSVEISYNQEAGYNALFDPVCDLEALKNTYKDGEELWVD